MSVSNLIDVMRAQTVLMNELAGLEKQVLSALLGKDSGAVQAAIERKRLLAEHLDQAESVRVALIAHIAAGLGIVSHAGTEARPVELYDRILVRLPDPERAQLQDTARGFRTAIRNMVGINQALRMYTEAQLNTLDTFLAELLPRREDGIYGADGRQAAASRPRLLNRQA